MLYLTLFLSAALLTAALTPLAGYVGRRLGMIDQPGGRRQHRGAIPRTGGLALYGGFILVVGLALWLPHLLPDSVGSWFPPRNDPNELRRLTALLVGSTFCVIAGFLDDRFEWSSGPQYLAQFVAALIAISGLIFIKHVNNPFGDGLLGGPDGLPWWAVGALTIFWFMGMMNTVNWLDGLSGLATGVTAILCTVLAIHMIFRAEPPQLSVALLPVILLGATVGFLPFNFSPARIFMGSSGSFFVGFVVAALGIIGGARLATVMLVLGLPALDVAWLIYIRRRRGISPGQGGRDHLHYRLLDKGISERTIVLGYWAFCALFGAMTLLFDDRVFKLAALVNLGIVALSVLIWAAREPTQDTN
jgi:UDP-GlcNAc:undecaprenyl-phosphate GlcNAc-1-phosphate transferase